MAEQLALTFEDPESNPYFLWSEDMTLRELREILAGSQGDYLRWVYSGRILREARIKDVWQFFTPAWISQEWTKVSPYLGRKRIFWQKCLEVWSRHGLL